MISQLTLADVMRVQAMEEAKAKAQKEEEERVAAARLKNLRLQEERREQELKSLARQHKLSAEKVKEPVD